MKFTKVVISALVALSLCGCTSQSWQANLKEKAPVYGHRNWIVIADSAYPLQSAPGIETIYTGGTQLDVLQTVLDELAGSIHIKPIVMVDAELDKVLEADAPGVDAYRTALKAMLAGRDFKQMPHEDIIAKLDEASKMFNVIILKTDLTIPYTSVFLELDCAYWNADKEKRLRESLK